MFQQVLNFLTRLKKNNNREWFEAHRPEFDKAKATFTEVVEQLIEDIGKIDPDISPLVAKDCIFRQYRDVRFSSDKTPYKTHIGAYLNKGGKRINTAGYYLHIEPGASILAGGLYHPESTQLQSVRQEIDYNLDEWNKLVSNKSLKKVFSSGISQEDTLKRPPRGYEPDNPALPYLKLKSFVFTKPLPDEHLINLRETKTLTASFITLTPVINFLNRIDE